MKKIINGKKYDTDTAKEVGSLWNGLAADNVEYFLEELYQKRTGEFFLYGTGGAFSKYSRSEGGNRYGISVIRPLTVEEAKEWAEKHLTGEAYEQIWGEVEE